MNYHPFDDNRNKKIQDKKIKDKLRSTFMNVRQNDRRNKLGKFIFGG